MGFPHIEGKLAQMVENKRRWKKKSKEMEAVLEKLKSQGADELDAAARMSIMQSEFGIF